MPSGIITMKFFGLEAANVVETHATAAMSMDRERILEARSLGNSRRAIQTTWAFFGHEGEFEQRVAYLYTPKSLNNSNTRGKHLDALI